MDRSLAATRARLGTQLQKIMDAAQALISEPGATEFTMLELANRAGVSTKTIYRHFSGRDELLLAVLEEEFRRAAITLRDAIDRTTTPLGKLRTAVQGYVALPLRYPAPEIRQARAREWQRLAAHRLGEVRHAAEPVLDVLRELLGHLAQAGLVDFGPEPEGNLELAVHTIHHVVTGHHLDVAVDSTDAAYERISDHVWRFCCCGLGLDPHDTGPRPSGLVRQHPRSVKRDLR
jgi:AcrR family transcriptional regulator